MQGKKLQRGDRVIAPTEPHPETRLPGYLTNYASRVFNRSIDAALRPHGLTLSLLTPLLLLRRHGPMLQRELVRSSPVLQPAMVALLTKLESLQLIVREPHPEDGRASIIRATREGIRLAALGDKRLKAENARGLQGFSAGDAEKLSELLGRLIHNLELD